MEVGLETYILRASTVFSPSAGGNTAACAGCWHDTGLLEMVSEMHQGRSDDLMGIFLFIILLVWHELCA